ncbi:MAG TPA: bifunctional [glutamine synthetase] adenylyltransferase/[glutamine synthetase]-adenylyl-L-tyrosine phosphorylase [Mesorhizobium sp.]|jgi:glutamate-ammonia-ligase adenylyltransferase|nr:bifunctional [glutamine synthetase] adenylyltransferase/[glutamine synthetase]-adenylyl-L-tyrosine phosphorylase [Mesorhizobium sp.]
MSVPADRPLLARALPELRPLDASAAGRALDELRLAADREGEEALAEALARSSPVSAFLAAALDLSPFFRDTLRKRPAIAGRMLAQAPDARLREIEEAVAAAAAAAETVEASLMRELRLAKNEAQIWIALAELAGEADTAQTVERLSALADACVRASVGFLLREACRAGKLSLPDPSQPGQGSGFIVLGMGKLGARELNFSSDIDLILFFEPQAEALRGLADAGDLFVRLARRLVRILSERTEHGYVFRTDLRLRPDPGSTPLAIPVEAALHYYEGRGQNWERAAMIKARALAGDLDAGERFLAELRPYVWRKHLDYAAIADIHSIKRQVHAHRGHAAVAVRGHNVKLGRGGIREVEFFVQTQQLIAGGRFPELRGRQTVTMLDELARQGWISVDVRDALARDYWFLRRVEHALQMARDEQTHTLPEDGAELTRIARLLGFAGEEDFSEGLRATLRDVETHYAALFEKAPELSAGIGNLVFTGDVDDPGTLQTLRSLGFERPSDISRVVRTWHYGRYRATRSAEARERLTELTPALLAAFARTGRADDTAIRFDAFLAGLPAGIQLFSLLHSNRPLLELLVTVLGAAPRLAAIITRRPHVFDGLLDPTLMSELPDRAHLHGRLQAFLAGTGRYEDVLDRLRIFAAEQKFLVGVRLLTGVTGPARAGRAFSDLADLTLAETLKAVEAEFAAKHGRVANGAVALLGMGKLGSRELTAGSDVDLILLYDHAPDAAASDGPKPLAPSLYYARLTQRLIAAVSAPTAEGVLFELDLRLRPSGNMGPVAVAVQTFGRYQRSEAWTWEHMALTRARSVAGDPELCARAEAEAAEVIALPRERAKVLGDAREMRARLLKEKPPRDLWDLKLVRGGLIELEFIAQCANLCGAVEGSPRRETGEALGRLAPDFASAAQRDALKDAFRLFSALTQIVRLCLTESLDPSAVSPGLTELILRAVDLPDWAVLEAHLKDAQHRVAAIFDEIVGSPA